MKPAAKLAEFNGISVFRGSRSTPEQPRTSLLKNLFRLMNLFRSLKIWFMCKKVDMMYVETELLASAYLVSF